MRRVAQATLRIFGWKPGSGFPKMLQAAQNHSLRRRAQQLKEMHWHDFTPKLVLEGAEKGARKSFASTPSSGHPARGRLRSRQVS
ncbi:hypothetical protein AGR4C_Cc10007 [Agrobacterium tumefaciens str. Kerr 14]|uniref:Uncharacterized protein n=1 Tax=Agrobacterium tumefaciens str. Kerr 14 TaxID=1183424 RepID=A0A1S7NIE9_AGRTU|nr:hypothetical protein AGR4C_Cc10007 [Agrobacterium tumefaciens str. Kerr 14]CUX11754.1 hypothetical protein AGR4B_Cc100253 [Agrobacterium tumefaciens str. CFBP 5621]